MLSEPAIAAERVRRSFGYAMIGANFVGAIVVFVIAAWVVPVPGVRHAAHVRTVNVIVFVPVMALSTVVAWVWSRRRWMRAVEWLREARQPSARERELALRFPLSQQQIHGTLWALAAVAFAALNAQYSGRVGLYVGTAIVLGGLVTCALGYLLAERILRPLTVAVLSTGLPDRPQLPGVAARALLSWLLGTGVLLLAVALLAIAALSIRRGFTLTRVSVSVLVLSGIGLLVGLTLTGGLARSLAQRIVALRSAASRVEQGGFDEPVTVDDGSELGLLQAGFNRMLAGLREREELRDLFGRQVGEEVVRQALERGVELGGEARDAAVLFIDLEASTALAESRDPVEVVRLLNAFFSIVVEVVAQHNGWVNKFEGDAALCVFGVPLADPDAAAGALAGARELRARLQAELPQVRAGIGVSAGRVVAGNVGAASRFEYTVIGDPVNEAARLSDLAKASEERVLASSSALDRAHDEAEHWQVREQVQLRGRSAPTTVAVPRD